jgi:glycosyltransferase involved in cell wall biosynthesis
VMVVETELMLLGGNTSSCPTVPASFLATSYNKAAYLSTVLESVWREAQLVGGEVILVDDGSTDGSDLICKAFAEAHPEIVFWRQENRGIFSTVNAIAAKARGRWVRFCDSDDPLIPGSTLRLIEAAEKTGAGVAHGQGIAYGPDPLIEDSLALPSSASGTVTLHPDGLMYLIREMDFTPSMTVCRTDALKEALPLPNDLVSCQDLALWLPIVSRLPIVSIDEPVCFNLKGVANQLSGNYALTIQQTIRITQRNGDLLSSHHKRAAMLKAVNRTRRWLRKARPDLNSIGAQIRLLAVDIRARLGLIDFKKTLGTIAEYYEHDLRPILEQRARPF